MIGHVISHGYVTFAQAAVMLGVGIDRIATLVASGALETSCLRPGNPPLLAITRESFDRYAHTPEA